MGSNNSSLSKSMFHNIRCASFLHAFHSVSLTNDWPYCGIKTWYSNIWPINQMASENKQTSERTRRVEEMWEDVERKLIYNSPASIWNLRHTHTLTLATDTCSFGTRKFTMGLTTENFWNAHTERQTHIISSIVGDNMATIPSLNVSLMVVGTQLNPISMQKRHLTHQQFVLRLSVKVNNSF